GHGMSFFTAAAWQHYLPAYLTHVLRSCRFSSTYFRPIRTPELKEYKQKRTRLLTFDQYAELKEYRRKRVELLTIDQCEVVVEYLSLCLSSHSRCSITASSDKLALDNWERILSRKKSVYKAG